MGPVPASRELAPGRHRVQVSREGFRPLSQWFELSGGQTYTLTATLQREAPAEGSILVAGDVSGATVLVDGQPRGVTPTIVTAPPGQHLVEIRPEGMEPHREVVSVEAGGRHTVNPTLRAAGPAGGTLRVLTEPSSAIVWVDGEERGSAPLSVDGLAPGSHIVEARQEGYRMASREVTVEGGRQTTIRLELTAEPSLGSIRVTSTVAGSEVFLDGRSLGTAPVDQSGVSAGEHLVVVRAPGNAEWQQRFTVAAGEVVTVQATPSASGTISVVSSVGGATVLVDGQLVGPAPVVEHRVEAGQHQVEVRAEGRQPFVANVTVAPGGAEHVSADLGEAGAAPQPAGDASPPVEGEGAPADEPAEGDEGEDEGEEEDGRRFTLSPAPLRPYKLGLDLSWGWPWLVGTYRIGLGVYEASRTGGVDVALEARSAYWLTEIDLHVRYGIRLWRIFALGAELGIGGGFGVGGRDSFGLSVTLAEGLELGPVVIALRERFALYSDDWAPVLGEAGEDEPRKLRPMFFLGLAFEWNIVGRLHLLAALDYAPGQEPRRRVMCGGEWTAVGETAEGTDIYDCNHWMPGGSQADSGRRANVAIEGRLGIGLRFF